MCGILAYIGDKISHDKLVSNLHLINHRGPDHSSFLSIDNVFLGHTRLSIMDLHERSNQPFEKGNFVLVFNGEVYNFKTLIKEHGLNVRTNSDTEVVLEMYIKYGEKCLDYFNGMFSIFIYDQVSKSYFIARDRLGIKPLYIHESDQGLVVCSEINIIQKLIQSDVDAFAVRQYRKLRMTVKNHTWYEKIQTFPAGFYRKNKQLHQYWKYSIEEKEAPSDAELRALIEDAVQLRKISDVPVGTYLSGGLDSTIITGLAKPDHTWTVGFEELNEFEWGQMAADRYKSEHHETLVDKTSFISVAKEMIASRMEPLSVPNEVLIYLMTESVKKKNTVVLSGEGADELFWGYDRIFRWANESKQFSLKEFDQHYCYGSHTDNEVLDYALEGINYNKTIDIVGHYFQITHLQGLLRRLDNSTMLCSVEARVPFVDHRLVERLAGVPFEWKMGNSFKEPLKRVFKDIVPDAIINRKKIGFPVPLSSIFSKEGEKTEMDSWLEFNINELDKILKG